MYILTNIKASRGLKFFSLSILNLRHSPLRAAERARMPEPALLSASQILILFFKIQVLRSFLGGKLNFLLPLSLKLLFFGNTTYYLDTPPFRYLRNGPSFFDFFLDVFFSSCTKLSSYQRPQPDYLSLAHLTSLIISAWLISPSAQLHPAVLAQQRSAVQCHSLPCTVVHCRAV